MGDGQRHSDVGIRSPAIHHVAGTRPAICEAEQCHSRTDPSILANSHNGGGMKPNTNGTGPHPVREPATSGTRRKAGSRAGNRGRTIMSIIVVSTAMALVLAAGIFFRREVPTVSAQSG